MTLSVRLDEKTISVLERTASILHKSKSDIVKLSVKEYCSHALEEQSKQPYELIKDLIDKEGSGRGDLSLKGEKILRTAFSARRKKG